MKKAFITGINGMDGSYLTEHLLEENYEVHGIIRRSATPNTKNIDHLMNNSEIMNKKLFIDYGDVTDASNISTLINKIQPDKVFNLAAQSHVKISFDIPQYTAQVDAIGTLNILEACRNYCPTAKIYQASTSEMFGGMKNEIPEKGFNENTPFHPRSPYGVAKLYAYWITKNYRESYNMFACSGLLFNHESPRRGENFVTRKITKWFAKYYKSKINNETINPIYIGNLDAFRDWGHAKDYVIAMNLILNKNTPDDFVIATGETYSIRQFFTECFKLINKKIEWDNTKGKDKEIGICDGEIIIKVDSKYYRPAEVDYLLGNPDKAKKELNWKPNYNFYTLVEDMVKSDLKDLNLKI